MLDSSRKDTSADLDDGHGQSFADPGRNDVGRRNHFAKSLARLLLEEVRSRDPQLVDHFLKSAPSDDLDHSAVGQPHAQPVSPALRVEGLLEVEHCDHGAIAQPALDLFREVFHCQLAEPFLFP